MGGSGVQEQCEHGQDLLTNQKYIEAEQELVAAEREAYRLKDWDTLSRLYMPLQEARRQRRQRALEGVVSFELLSQGPGDNIEGRHVIENFPHGVVLVAGWGSIEPAIQTRKLASRFRLYLDVFLAAKFPIIGGGHAVVVFPHEFQTIPDLSPRRIEDFGRLMPRHSILIREEQLPTGLHKGNQEIIQLVQSWWENLHLPFLRDARECPDPVKKIEKYRRTIHVDYACEFAHQELSSTARDLARSQITS